METQLLIKPTVLLEKADVIYKFAPTIEILLDLVNSPSTSVREVIEHMDPAVASEILKLANSAYYCSSKWQKTTSLERAIMVIGFEAVSQIVLELFMLSLTNGNSPYFDTKAFIEHSLVTAVLSKDKHQTFRTGTAPDELYLAGLLHDIGKPVIYNYLPDSIQQVKHLCEKLEIPEYKAEKMLFGLDHAEIGSMVLSKWGIDVSLTTCVLLHHSDKADLPEDVKIITEANEKAKQITIPVDIFKQHKPPVAVIREVLSSREKK